MKFFINNKLLLLEPISSFSIRTVPRLFDTVVRSHEAVHSGRLVGRVIIYDATPFQIFTLLGLMETKKLKKLTSVTFAVSALEDNTRFIKDRFQMIKAAGGLVTKDDLILLIYRLGKWDLPKGKLEKKEKSGPGALREVEEECGLKVQLKAKICNTYHSYSLNGNKMMKKTSWYAMDCLNDSKMKPQLEEGITRIQWMNKAEIKEALKNSYPSIIEVVVQYYLSQGQEF